MIGQQMLSRPQIYKKESCKLLLLKCLYGFRVPHNIFCKMYRLEKKVLICLLEFWNQKSIVGNAFCIFGKDADIAFSFFLWDGAIAIFIGRATRKVQFGEELSWFY